MKWNSVGLLALGLFAAGGFAAGGAGAQEPILDEAYFLEAADEAMESGDEAGGVQLYQSAIIYAPGDPVPYLRLAEFYAKSREPELAQRYFGIALDVRPAFAPALQGLALLELSRGDLAAALAQHNLLLYACGASCPETAEVEKALSESGVVLDRAEIAQ